jgi:hypothetical protein
MRLIPFLKIRAVAIVILSVAIANATSVPPTHGAPGTHRAPIKTSVDSDVPVAIFQRVDKQLTTLDSNNQALQTERKRLDALAGARPNRRMLRQVQRSPQYRERLRAVNQLLATSSHAERIYRARSQNYGARLFSDLHTKAVQLKKPMIHAQTASTKSSFDRDERLVDARLLSVVMQFQAISGGYTGLACRPGSWACCQPHVIKDGKLELRGCAWSCASKLSACRGGCLGPRIPKTVVAVKNTVPKLPARTRRPALAANDILKSKPANRNTVPAHRQTTTIGNE